MKKRRFGICLALAAAAGTLSLAGCGGDTAMADVLSAGMEQEMETFWRKIFHLNSADNAVRITLPEHMVEEIAVSSDISDVHISGQKIRRISVNANNGNVELSACEG